MIQDGISFVEIEDALTGEFEDYLEIINSLLEIVNEEKDTKIERVNLSELISGYVLVKDIRSTGGVKLICKDTEITRNLLQMLHRYSRQETIHEPIYVKKY